MDNQKQNISEEQLAYANILDIGMKIGFVLLLASFCVYVFGVVEPHIAHTDLPKYWTMPVDQYLAATDISTGWSWLKLAGKGDFMNFIGIAFLSMVTILCYLRILPILFKNKDTVYGVIAILEVLVLVLAASGLFAGSH
jgi:hypothetical protein